MNHMLAHNKRMEELVASGGSVIHFLIYKDHTCPNFKAGHHIKLFGVQTPAVWSQIGIIMTFASLTLQKHRELETIEIEEDVSVLFNNLNLINELGVPHWDDKR